MISSQSMLEVISHVRLINSTVLGSSQVAILYVIQRQHSCFIYMDLYGPRYNISDHLHFVSPPSPRKHHVLIYPIPIDVEIVRQPKNLCGIPISGLVFSKAPLPEPSLSLP